MSPATATCPSCGGTVTFRTASSVVIRCDFCGTVLARSDARLEAIGKLSAVTETASPLALDLRGHYGDVGFRLVGRVQLAHAAGGLWEEWYAHFDDGHWGWIAEAMGRFSLSRPLPEGSVPAFDRLELGAPVTVIAGAPALVVHEKGEARVAAAAGEMPEPLEIGTPFRYADLSGPAGSFATIDYGDEPPSLYFGREVTLADLGLQQAADAPRAQSSVDAVQLACSQCGGEIALAAPDQAMRVGCRHCGALHDVNRGNLAFLRALEVGPEQPLIPLGAVGTLDDVQWTVIGFLVRSVTIEAIRYPWQELLLHAPRAGFRWLTSSDDHWNLVTAVPAGEVAVDGRAARVAGKSFKLFQDARAQVDQLAGEFYWQVEIGETVRARDFISPPEILSIEETIPETETAAGSSFSIERNVSRGRWLAVEEVEQAFGLTGLRRPNKVAPNQPYFGPRIVRPWLVLSALVLAVAFLLTGSRETILSQSVELPEAVASAAPHTVFFDAQPFSPRKNVQIRVDSKLQNGWLAIDGDLYDTISGEVHPFSLSVGRYSGVEGGESWSEGSTRATTYLSAPGAGPWATRLTIERGDAGLEAQTIRVTISQGVLRPLPLIALLGLLAIGPIGALIRRMRFEQYRWEDSAYNPYASEDDDDE